MLRELSEEGLPDGWEQYWHGKRDTLQETLSVFAAYFPENISYIENAGKIEIETMLRSARTLPSLDDPFLLQLWNKERQCLTGWVEKEEKSTGQESLARHLPDMYQSWAEKLIRSLEEYIANGTLPMQWSLLRTLADRERIWQEWTESWELWLRSNPAEFQEFLAAKGREVHFPTSRASTPVQKEAVSTLLGKRPYENFLRSVCAEVSTILERDRDSFYSCALLLLENSSRKSLEEKSSQEIIIRATRTWLRMQTANQDPLWSRLAAEGRSGYTSLFVAISKFSYQDFCFVAGNKDTLESSLRRYL